MQRMSLRRANYEIGLKARDQLKYKIYLIFYALLYK